MGVYYAARIQAKKKHLKAPCCLSGVGAAGNKENCRIPGRIGVTHSGPGPGYSGKCCGGVSKMSTERLDKKRVHKQTVRVFLTISIHLL